MVIEKLILLPSIIYLKDELCEFSLQVFKNDDDDVRIAYILSDVDKESNHYPQYKKYNSWYNRYLNNSCNFLYLVEGIETDEEFVEAVEEIIKFLRTNKVHNINPKGGGM